MNAANFSPRLLLARAGFAAMLLGFIWPFCATWLSANRWITVIAELATFWVSIMAVLLGAWCMRRAKQGNFKSGTNTTARLLAGPLALLLVAWMWLLSDSAFFRFKLNAIRPEAWAQMVTDLERLAASAPVGDTLRLPGSNPPESLRQLGLGGDYVGINAASVNYPDYRGPVADVLFGNKSRTWGLWMGPKKSLDAFCPRCRQTQVAPNAFFFVGQRG